MESIRIVYEIKALPTYAVVCKDGRKTLEIQAFDGALTVSVQYDCNRRPLELNAEVGEGDRVELILLPHRIELYVNGDLKDEEWPEGERLFDLGDSFLAGDPVECYPYEEDTAPQPNVLGTFEQAEGWRPGNGVFVGDCMPYRRDDEYHVLYLKDRHHHRSKWGLGAHQWEHLSTKDFKAWQIHPMAVPITKPEEGSICTGSWIREGDREYLYYTVRRSGGRPAPICRSVSTDGYHFVKDESFGFTVSERYHGASARDPKVVRGEDGLYHMFLTTSLTESGNGCLAHYVSPDLETWEEAAEPIYVVPGSAQPECPDYIAYGGRYYLIFSLYGRARYMVSDKPFEGFVMPEHPEIPCAGVPKGALWGDRIVFAGFKVISGYAGTMTFKAATANERGELIFEEM
ncbi:MAG: hypothetical protein J6D21_07690 [Clostridia bacterium]|nr:hypothetical protein [Clostridia bacterium]